MKRSIAVVAAAVAFAAAAPAAPAHAVTTHYLSPTGDDTGNCTSSACFTLSYGISQLGAGDSLVVHGGDYTGMDSASGNNVGRTVAPNTNCSAVAPCSVYTDQGQPTTPSFAYNPTIWGCPTFNQPQYITLTRIDFRYDSNGSCTTGGHMVTVNGGTNWSFTQSEFGPSSANISEIRVYASPTNWTLSTDCFHDATYDSGGPLTHNLYIGDGQSGSGGLITRSVVWNSPYGSAVKMGPGTAPGGPDGVTFSYSTVWDSSDNDVLVSENSDDITLDHLLLVEWGGSNNADAATRGSNLATDVTNLNLSNIGYYDDDDGSPELTHYYPDPNEIRFTVSGTNTRANPQWTDAGSCIGFHPAGGSGMAGYGRWAT
jgi:hypothetical protein